MCSLLVIISICIGLHYFVGPEENLTFSCQANLHGKDVDRVNKVEVVIKVVGEAVSLMYRFIESGGEINSIILSGKIDKLDLASLTFKLKLEHGQIISNLTQKSFSNHMAAVIDSSRLAITSVSPLLLDIQLIEIDEMQNYAIIQFAPDDGLWGCDLKDNKLTF
ncbi:hypothetical protein HWQ46_22010 [Shewanella sp. D64]|nr:MULTISPECIES: hypothetical protein [unclassified Shewanella]MEC4728215.1 hypothetical protein [Shewanella sp. D64]WBJ94368.1 hypothetical protein HWQ47_21245 [Shewanella sp. MTB7]